MVFMPSFYSSWSHSPEGLSGVSEKRRPVTCMSRRDMPTWKSRAVSLGIGTLGTALWLMPSLLAAQVTPESVPPSSEQYSETLEVTVVEVPVRVLVKGEPVAG